ncbi:MAG: DUF1127 domain-containing protein [Pseudomonadota bacterium]
MAYASTAEAGSGLFNGLFAKYSEAKVEHFRRRIYSKTVRDLENLSDRQLADIGVPRDQIKQRAYASVYQGAPYRR